MTDFGKKNTPYDLRAADLAFTLSDLTGFPAEVKQALHSETIYSKDQATGKTRAVTSHETKIALQTGGTKQQVNDLIKSFEAFRDHSIIEKDAAHLEHIHENASTQHQMTANDIKFTVGQKPGEILVTLPGLFGTEQAITTALIGLDNKTAQYALIQERYRLIPDPAQANNPFTQRQAEPLAQIPGLSGLAKMHYTEASVTDLMNLHSSTNAQVTVGGPDKNYLG